MALEKYQSEFTAEEFENAIRAVPKIGANGNWFIGDNDTGVFAGGVKVEGAEVGQTILVKAVDEKGVPTEWEPKTIHPFNIDPWGWEEINRVTLSVDDQVNQVVFTTDADGAEFAYDELAIFASNVYGSAGSAIKVWLNRDTSISDNFTTVNGGLVTGAQGYTKFPYLYAKIIRSFPDNPNGNRWYIQHNCELWAKGSAQQMIALCDMWVTPSQAGSNARLTRKLYKIGFLATASTAYINGTFILYGRNYA